MKRFGLLLTIVALAGCGDAPREFRLAEVEPASTYKPGHGLELTPTAAAFIGLESAEFATLLPGSALLRTAKGDFVYVANGRHFLRTPVVVTGAAGSGFQVKEGLYEGDVIATAGVDGLWLAELQAINGGVGCAHGH